MERKDRSSDSPAVAYQMKKPRVRKGFSQIWQDEQRLRRVIYPDLHIIPITTRNAGEHQSFNQLTEPSRSLKARKDFILIDTPVSEI
jgi:cellulose biosynthesis protein BcsQ